MAKALVIGAAVLGLVLLGLTAIYWTVPAGSLPSFLPGYQSGSADLHFKHGLASLLLAVALFIFAWFRIGPKRT